MSDGMGCHIGQSPVDSTALWDPPEISISQSVDKQTSCNCTMDGWLASHARAGQRATNARHVDFTEAFGNDLLFQKRATVGTFSVGLQ